MGAEPDWVGRSKYVLDFILSIFLCVTLRSYLSYGRASGGRRGSLDIANMRPRVTSSSFCPPAFPEMGCLHPPLRHFIPGPRSPRPHPCRAARPPGLPLIYCQAFLLQGSLTPTCAACVAAELKALDPRVGGPILPSSPLAGGHLCLQTLRLLLGQRHEPAVPRVL